MCHTYETIKESPTTEMLSLAKFLTEFSKSDIWLECACSLLSRNNIIPKDQLLIVELERFFSELNKVPDFINACINSEEVSSDGSSVFLESRARLLSNVPHYVANVIHENSYFTNVRHFVERILSTFDFNLHVSEVTYQLLGLIVSHLCLAGYSKYVTDFIVGHIQHDSTNFWSKLLVHLNTKSMEMCLSPLAKECPTPEMYHTLSSSFLETSSLTFDAYLRLCRRLFYIRQFKTGNTIRNIFSSFCMAVLKCQSPKKSADLAMKVDEVLGLPALRLWSDLNSLQTASLERRIYLSQILISWFVDFRNPVRADSSINLSHDHLLPDVLNGISIHLGSPRVEIRTLGMVIGEWIVNFFNWIPGDENQELKFEYEELSFLKQIRPYFIPLNKTPNVESTDRNNALTRISQSNETSKIARCSPDTEAKSEHCGVAKHTIDELDSDDDPNSDSSSMIPLPSVSTPNNDNKAPFYLRECLDGMLLSKVEDNRVNIACTLSAEKLIYAHPEAAQELALEFARVLVHIEPPVTPDPEQIARARHRALIAIGVVAPKKCARYLTSEFCQSGYSIGQRMNIISSLTDIACKLYGGKEALLSQKFSSRHQTANNDVLTVSSDNEKKVRRFCKKRSPPSYMINKFAPFAGEFFFPLLKSIPQLSLSSVKGPFAHQDASLLAILLASLGLLYALFRFCYLMEKELANVLLLNNSLKTPTIVEMKEDKIENHLNNNKENIYDSKIQFSFNLSSSSICEHQNLTSDSSLRPIHAEVSISPYNCEEFATIESYVVDFLRRLGPRHIPTVLNTFDNELNLIVCDGEIKKLHQILTNCVVSINLMLDEADGIHDNDAGRSVNLCIAPILVHIYQLVNGDEALPVQELIEFGSESINGGTTWLLPSAEMLGLWESLIFDTDIKLNLLQYAQTALLFADREVSSSVISWNRVILLYGPPGTGKTSLCRALANKLAIRMADRYSSTQLIEINTMNLMSKWFSESARLVTKMFDSIKEYLESHDHLVCLLVDEVESLTAIRTSSMSGCEPSDAIRVVNSVLTQIDQIKRYPNVLIMATSNVTGVIDPAFLDRADVRIFIGPPSPPAIYSIYRTCLYELIRVGLITSTEDSRLLSYQTLASVQFTENQANSLSMELWRLAEHSHGLNGRTLRKLPLLAYAFHLNKVIPDMRYTSVIHYRRIHLPPSESNINSKNNINSSILNETSSSLGNVATSSMCMNESIHSSTIAPAVATVELSSPLLTPIYNCVKSNNDKNVSLDAFIKALRLTVDAQFIELKSLDLATSMKGRLIGSQ
ncbi:Pachytene checkpoint protein 2 [Schistosoma japonicum]|uniref:Pachytene checkpoint protein 2 n=1 Tax=Schistosoma japonicum TaxID=6182 RepID=A0A4Z2CSD6_SCHJA|nr:Pachytene checkpoint protein 2 [Schistosoma japonicum]